MTASQPTPATLTPHQAGRAAWALRFQIEDDLQLVLERHLDEHFNGHGPMALSDADEHLHRALENLDALRALGTPVPVRELLADALERAEASAAGETDRQGNL